MKLTIHLCPVPRLRISGAILLLPIHAFMAWKGTTLLLCFFLLLIWMLFKTDKILNYYKWSINRIIMGSRCNWKLIHPCDGQYLKTVQRRKRHKAVRSSEENYTTMEAKS